MKYTEDIHTLSFYVLCLIPFIWIGYSLWLDAKDSLFKRSIFFLLHCIFYLLIVYFLGDPLRPLLFGLVSLALGGAIVYVMVKHKIEKDIAASIHQEESAERDRNYKQFFEEYDEHLKKKL